MLKRWKFAARSEQWRGVQGSLLEETIEADLEAIAVELADWARPRTPERRETAEAQAAASPPAAGRGAP